MLTRHYARILILPTIANTGDGAEGEDFQDSATVAQSFLRQTRDWLKARFGDFKYDPDRKDIEIYLFIPGISHRHSGGSIGAAFTGE